MPKSKSWYHLVHVSALPSFCFWGTLGTPREVPARATLLWRSCCSRGWGFCSGAPVSCWTTSRKFTASTLYTLAGVGGIGATGAFFLGFADGFLTEWSQELCDWRGYTSFISPLDSSGFWVKYEELDEEKELE